MARVTYSDTALLDLAAAVTAIWKYFEDRNLIELGEKHVLSFKAEMRAKEQLLQDNPELNGFFLQLYAVRFDDAFGTCEEKIRSFAVHWFTAFYTYEADENEVVIWFIRSSKSDFSNLIYLDRSRSS